MASLTAPLEALPQVLSSVYELGLCIGMGSYARVYEVCNRATGERRALKVVDKAPLEARAILETVVKEARFLQEVVGLPSIVHLYQVIDVPDRFFMVFELCERSLMHLPRAVDEEVALGWLREACYGVKELHDRGIIHRDLKPGNLLLTADGGIRICDFGFACRAEDAPAGVTGSRQYAAPEQLRGGLQTAKVDIYSLGACLQHFLLGRMPLGAQDMPVSASQEALDLLNEMMEPCPEMRPTIEEVLARPIVAESKISSFPVTTDCVLAGCSGREQSDTLLGALQQVMSRAFCCSKAPFVVYDDDVTA